MVMCAAPVWLLSRAARCRHNLLAGAFRPWLRGTWHQQGEELRLVFRVMSKYQQRNQVGCYGCNHSGLEGGPLLNQRAMAFLLSPLPNPHTRSMFPPSSAFWECRISLLAPPTPPGLWNTSPCFPLPSEGYTSDYETKWSLKWEINGWAGLDSLEKYVQAH